MPRLASRLHFVPRLCHTECRGQAADPGTEVASALCVFVSKRAVDARIDSIFAKLGLSEQGEVHCRAQAVLLHQSEQR